MPVSRPTVIPYVCDWLKDKSRHEIRSVLDVGCGFGLWGFLARNFIQIWNPDITRSDYLNWKRNLRVDAIEAVDWYVTSMQREIYNEIHVGGMVEIMPTLGSYHLIIVGDTLEHVSLEDGLQFIKNARERSRWLVITMPSYFHRGSAIMGNDSELHEYVWKDSDFPGNPKITHIGNQRVIQYG